jgi:hypothetical protein
MTEDIVYTEAEAAAKLHLTNERALREFRYQRLKRGVHYTKIKGKILYSPEHIRRILHIDDRQEQRVNL